MKLVMCKACNTEFYQEDRETLCLACDIEQEEQFQKEEDAMSDNMFDGFLNTIDTEWSEY